ncbi:hypothetical protein BH10PLA2_BH10PLA2_25250 [soil metagenome]
MCLGVPGLVIDIPNPADALAWATVEFAGIRRKVCLACVPEARAGDYVIVHAGFALSMIDANEAQQVFRYLEATGEMGEWTEGEGGIVSPQRGQQEMLTGELPPSSQNSGALDQ